MSSQKVKLSGRKTALSIMHIKVAIFILFIGCCFPYGCTEIAPPGDGSDRDLPGMELFSATVKYHRDENLMFTIQAPHISRLEPQQMLLLEGGIKVDFFDPNGNHTAVLTSDKGSIKERINRLKATGNVIVKSDSGLVLLADELYYEEKINRVLSDGFVTIITKNDSISGKGFSASPDLQDWQIFNSSGTTWRETSKTND